MDELGQRDRLQPSLLDRLTDREPEQPEESRARRVISLRRLRESVTRDLGWLLNTSYLAVTEDLDAYPHVKKSVLNYGTPDFSGRAASGIDARALERAVRQAILDFEPRLLPNTVRVQVRVDQEDMSRNALTFEIEAQMWAQPTPTRLFLKTRLDLERGSCVVDDGSSSSAARD